MLIYICVCVLYILYEHKYSDDPRERLASVLGEGRHGWIAGYYSESLSPQHDKQVVELGMKPASYIDIDCDLYESTRDALDFFFRNGERQERDRDDS
jgi:hypothetical protein